MADVEPFLELVREVFGNEPEAINLWIRGQRSVSAVHKDHYEVRKTGEGLNWLRDCRGDTKHGMLMSYALCAVKKFCTDKISLFLGFVYFNLSDPVYGMLCLAPRIAFFVLLDSDVE